MSCYKPTQHEKEVLNEILAKFTDYQALRTRIRKSTYKGKGRPRNDDFIVLPKSEVQNYLNYECLVNGFVTIYTKIQK